MYLANYPLVNELIVQYIPVTAVDCPSLSPPINGAVTINGISTGSVAK